MNTKLIFILFFACLPFNVWGNDGQKPVYYQSFDIPSAFAIQKGIDAITGSADLKLVYQPSFCKGLKGSALDLTANVPFRIPFFLEESQTPSYDSLASFSLQIWLQTEKSASQGTPIMSNKKSNDRTSPGWILGTKENGAWYWNMSDGHTQFDYEPTQQRQAINDGKWHQLTISVDREKNELRLYFDGKNVAIYNIPGLKSMKNKLRTAIGGSDEYTDWGSRGEWMAFNGRIDEVQLWDYPLTSQEVEQSYQQFFPLSTRNAITPDRIKVQVWNIWHGGHRYGQSVGVERTIDVLKRENADIIGLIETYGSGAIIADSLGYYFYLISSNLSILSRYPIEKTIPVFKPFNSGGAVIDLGNYQKITFFDIWLHYLPNMCELVKGSRVLESFQKEELKTRASEINAILKEIRPWIDEADKSPVIMVGDFNSDSHLDWSETYKTVHQGMVIPFPVSISMEKTGFRDSYRQLHPNVFTSPGHTWSPLINPAAKQPDCIPCRIDYIYYKGKKLVPYFSAAIDHHPVFWPSDHGSVVTSFYLTGQP